MTTLTAMTLGLTVLVVVFGAFVLCRRRPEPGWSTEAITLDSSRVALAHARLRGARQAAVAEQARLLRGGTAPGSADPPPAMPALAPAPEVLAERPSAPQAEAGARPLTLRPPIRPEAWRIAPGLDDDRVPPPPSSWRQLGDFDAASNRAFCALLRAKARGPGPDQRFEEKGDEGE